jgi:hypothetical protein
MGELARPAAVRRGHPRRRERRRRDGRVPRRRTRRRRRRDRRVADRALAARGDARPAARDVRCRGGLGAAEIARVAPILLAWRLPYAGGGTGVWTSGLGAARVGAAAVIGIAIGAATSGIAAAWMAAALVVVCLGLGRWSQVRLGGVTGDVFGASAELSEALALVAAVALA